LPVHSPNDLYDTRFRLFTLQSPFLMGKTQRAIDLLSDQRFVDLDANLHYFAEKYDAVLARHDEDRDTMATVRGTPFRRVARLYDQYIHTQRDEVRAMERVAAVSSEPSKPTTAN
jgi:hypothetical protein